MNEALPLIKEYYAKEILVNGNNEVSYTLQVILKNITTKISYKKDQMEKYFKLLSEVVKE